ncbi:hypothetical protein J3E69DRAFT_335198 [Trichoderma sp. SZMC 28015]
MARNGSILVHGPLTVLASCSILLLRTSVYVCNLYERGTSASNCAMQCRKLQPGKPLTKGGVGEKKAPTKIRARSGK